VTIASVVTADGNAKRFFGFSGVSTGSVALEVTVKSGQ